MDNKQKQAKLNRVLYVALIMILCVMAVIIAITSSLNRAKRGNIMTPNTSDNVADTKAPSSTSSPVTTSAPKETTPPDTTEKEDTTAPEKPTNADVPSDILPDFYLPVNGNIAKAHDDTSPVYSATMNDYRVHLGIDIAANAGTPVKSAADGTVSQIWEDPLMGTCVSVAHTGGAVTIYKNLVPASSGELAVGDSVSHGQVIGAVGESALVEVADAPHLHFEMTVGGVLVNPTDYLPEAVRTSAEQIYEG